MVMGAVSLLNAGAWRGRVRLLLLFSKVPFCPALEGRHEFYEMKRINSRMTINAAVMLNMTFDR